MVHRTSPIRKFHRISPIRVGLPVRFFSTSRPPQCVSHMVSFMFEKKEEKNGPGDNMICPREHIYLESGLCDGRMW